MTILIKTTSTLLAATLCVSALVTPQARAQFGYGDAFGNSASPNSFLYDAFVYQRPINLYVGREVESTMRKSSPDARHTPKKALTTTTYRESSAVRKRVVGQFTSFVTKQMTSKADADAVRRDFAGDTLGLWAKDVAAPGLRRGDVADAMTAYWVMNWVIANRVTDDIQTPRIRGARRQLAGVLASNRAFARLSNAGRQEMAEALIYNQVLQTGAFYKIAKIRDRALWQRFSDARAASFKTEMGVDLRTVRLTNAGFAAK